MSTRPDLFDREFFNTFENSICLQLELMTRNIYEFFCYGVIRVFHSDVSLKPYALLARVSIQADFYRCEHLASFGYMRSSLIMVANLPPGLRNLTVRMTMGYRSAHFFSIGGLLR